MHNHIVSDAIDNSPLNRGLNGCDWVADKRNVAIVDDDDITLFDYEAPGIYQVHFLYHARGKEAIKQAKAAFSEMFRDHGATVLFGLAPDFRRDVKLMGRWLGGTFSGLRSTSDGPCELYTLTKETWERQQSWVS